MQQEKKKKKKKKSKLQNDVVLELVFVHVWGTEKESKENKSLHMWHHGKKWKDLIEGI